MKIKFDIINDIRTQQLIWYELVQKMPQNRIPKQMFIWKKEKGSTSQKLETRSRQGSKKKKTGRRKVKGQKGMEIINRSINV